MKSGVDIFKRQVQAAKAEREARNKLLSYWPKFFPDTTYSPKEFYALVLKELEATKVPDLEASGLMLRQGGIFSSRRLYLHLRRERLVFEVCGFPFGTGFFVSSRLFDRRREAAWFHYLLTAFIVFVVGSVTTILMGVVWALIIVSGIFCLIWSLMRLAEMNVAGTLDGILIELPLLGQIYETLFHPDTYHRQDTNNAYRDAVHHALMRSIDAFTSEKGLRRLHDEERQPYLRDMYRK